MPLYQPRNMQPSSFSQFNTIDATQDNIFSCEIDGNVAVNAYRLLIRKSDNTIVYDTNKVTTNTELINFPFYPRNPNGNKNIFQVKVPKFINNIGEITSVTNEITSSYSNTDIPHNLPSGIDKNIYQFGFTNTSYNGWVLAAESGIYKYSFNKTFVSNDTGYFYNNCILTIANYGATVLGTVLVTTQSLHGLTTGDIITQSQSTTPAYNGTFTVTVVSTTTYYITAIYSNSLYSNKAVFTKAISNQTDYYKWQLQIWSNPSNTLPDVKSYEEIFYANSIPTVGITGFTTNKIIINSIVDNGTGIVRVTTNTNHGLSDGDIITQVTNVSNYNGDFIVDYIDVTQYNITAPHSGTTTGYLYKADILSSKSKTFEGIYSQLQNIPIQSYGWILKEIKFNQVLVDTITSNNIYGSGDNIELYYDGFFNNTIYSVQLMVTTQNGISILTDEVYFTVNYTSKPISGSFSAKNVESQSAIMCEWDVTLIEGKMIQGESSKIIISSFEDNADFVKVNVGLYHNLSVGDVVTQTTVSGVYNGFYSIQSIGDTYYNILATYNGTTTGYAYAERYLTTTPDLTDMKALNLESNTSVVFDTVATSEFDISIDSTHIWNGSLNSNDLVVLYKATGSDSSGNNYTLQLSYEKGRFIYNKNNTNIKSTPDLTISNISAYNGGVKIITSIAHGLVNEDTICILTTLGIYNKNYKITKLNDTSFAISENISAVSTWRFCYKYIYSPYYWNWYLIIMDENLEISTWTKTGDDTQITYPSETQTPSEFLTPNAGIWSDVTSVTYPV